jgi:hypothetical protein
VREECRIGGYQVGLTTEESLMHGERRQEQITIARALGVDLIVGDSCSAISYVEKFHDAAARARSTPQITQHK